MPKADAINNTHPTAGTLSAVAAALGEIEPPDGSDLQAAHFRRLDVLHAAAKLLPVRSADDAALALSLVSDIHGNVVGFELSDNEREAMIDDANAILSSTMRWLMELGARLLRSICASDLFDEQQAD